MSVTDNPPNNSNSTLFKFIHLLKFILIIFMCLFLCVIILNILRGSLRISFLVTSFVISYLQYIDFLKELVLITKVFLPAINIIVANLILFLFLSLIRYILDKIDIDSREKLMDYITYKGWKIDFYNLIVCFKRTGKSFFSASYYLDSEILKRISLPGFLIFPLIYLLTLFFVACFINASYTGEDILGVNVLESQNLSNYIDSNWKSFEFIMALIVNIFVSLINTVAFFWGFLILIEMIPIFVINYLFSKKAGVVDLSDLPISFVEVGIQQLQAIDFSESFDQIQYKKNQISNRINNSIHFIKVDKEKTYVDNMNFCFSKCCGLQNKDAIDDIRFRLNGLSEKMNNILINVNHMNNIEEKNEILKDLEMCIKVIKNKDLSKIEPKEFVTEKLTIDKALSFFFKNVLLPVTVVILTQMLI